MGVGAPGWGAHGGGNQNFCRSRGTSSRGGMRPAGVTCGSSAPTMLHAGICALPSSVHEGDDLASEESGKAMHTEGTRCSLD